MKLQAFNNFNLKKKRELSMSVNSLLSKYLLWDVGGACANAEVKSSRVGMGPSSSIHFPVKCPHQKPVVCSGAHCLVFSQKFNSGPGKWLLLKDLSNRFSES